MSALKVFTLAKLCYHSVDNTKLLDYREHWNVVRTCVTRGCAQCTMYNACSSVPCVSFYHLLMSSVTTIEQRHSNMQSIYYMWYRSKILTRHLYIYIYWIQTWPFVAKQIVSCYLLVCYFILGLTQKNGVWMCRHILAPQQTLQSTLGF